jgi:hypothetical protein
LWGPFQPFFGGEILPKNEINFFKRGDFGGFQLLEVRKEIPY